MGSNKKESLIFTSLMCALMVLGMTFYNVILVQGFQASLFRSVAIGYLPAFLIALLLDLFIVGPLAKKIAGRLVKPQAPLIHKVLTISICMVLGMVIWMSFYGAVTHVGFTSGLGQAYVHSLWTNLIAALPLQLILVGPIARAIFLKMYPPQKNMADSHAAA